MRHPRGGTARLRSTWREPSEAASCDVITTTVLIIARRQHWRERAMSQTALERASMSASASMEKQARAFDSGLEVSSEPTTKGLCKVHGAVRILCASRQRCLWCQTPRWRSRCQTSRWRSRGLEGSHPDFATLSCWHLVSQRRELAVQCQ